MAAAYAEVVAARENPIPLGMPVLFALLGVGAFAVFVGWIPLFLLVPLFIAVVVRPIQARMIAKAAASAAANRALALETGVHVPELPQPEPAWHGYTPWGVAAVIVLLFAFHVGGRALFGGGDATALPPLQPMAEPAPIDKEDLWFSRVQVRCLLAERAIAALDKRDGRTFRARRFEIRAGTFDAIGAAGVGPGGVDRALAHIERALRLEEQAVEAERGGLTAAKDWKAAAREADAAVALFTKLGLGGRFAAVFT